MRILFVEDDQEIAEWFAEDFRELGHEVKTAYSGEEALEICLVQDFDFIFTDYNLGGGMTGIDMADKLTELGKTPKIFLVTGSMTARERAGKNITKIFNKPILPETLVSVLSD